MRENWLEKETPNVKAKLRLFELLEPVLNTKICNRAQKAVTAGYELEQESIYLLMDSWLEIIWPENCRAD